MEISQYIIQIKSCFPRTSKDKFVFAYPRPFLPVITIDYNNISELLFSNRQKIICTAIYETPLFWITYKIRCNIKSLFDFEGYKKRSNTKSPEFLQGLCGPDGTTNAFSILTALDITGLKLHYLQLAVTFFDFSPIYLYKE